jgi:hypothetical protein
MSAWARPIQRFGREHQCANLPFSLPVDLTKADVYLQIPRLRAAARRGSLFPMLAQLLTASLKRSFTGKSAADRQSLGKS